MQSAPDLGNETERYPFVHIYSFGNLFLTSIEDTDVTSDKVRQSMILPDTQEITPVIQKGLVTALILYFDPVFAVGPLPP